MKYKEARFSRRKVDKSTNQNTRILYKYLLKYYNVKLKNTKIQTKYEYEKM